MKILIEYWIGSFKLMTFSLHFGPTQLKYILYNSQKSAEAILLHTKTVLMFVFALRK